MKIVTRYKILILTLILISSFLVAFSLYQNGRLGILTRFTTKIKTLPASYQECDEKYPKTGNFDSADYIFPFCNFFVEEDDPLYQECLAHGGIETEEICALCPGCGCIPAGCKLTYIDPNFTLPENYDECRKIFTHAGGSISEAGYKREYCSISLPKRGVFNKKVGERFFNECLNMSEKISGDNESCELKFYKD